MTADEKNQRRNHRQAQTVHEVFPWEDGMCRREHADDPESRPQDFPEDDDPDQGIRSSTDGDYSPGNPWDAPGMSIRDFI